MRLGSWKAHFFSTGVVGVVVLSFACGSSDVSSTKDGTGVGSIDASFGEELSALPGVFTGTGDLSACSGSNAIVAGSALDYAATLAHTNQFETMSDAQNASLTAAARSLLAGDVATAGSHAAGAGYAVTPVRFPTECLWALTPGLTAPAGQATFLVRPRHRYDLAFEAPHIPGDFHTDQEAALLFDILGARVVMLEGAIRCAVTLPSGCHTNTECLANGTAVQSDVAHAVANGFQALHLGLMDPAFSTVAVQLHANTELSLNGDATISDGEREDDSTNTAALARALASVSGRDIRDCEDSVHPPATAEYCGDGNAQGLASNGSANACTGSAQAASQRFFHVEQDEVDLDDYVGWAEKMATALQATFAPVPLDDDAGAGGDGGGEAGTVSDGGEQAD